MAAKGTIDSGNHSLE